MGKFITTEVPAWRIALWGVVAALAVCGLSYYSDRHFDWRVLIPAAFVGLLFSGFGFFLLWSSRSGWAGRHMRSLLVVYVVGQAVLLILAIASHKK